MTQFPLDTISKVFVILDSIKESKIKYIEVVNPITNDPVMKIKLNLEGSDYVNFLDTFFDAGFKIRSIDKDDFDDLETNDIVKFNL
jgi:hypothetical protein